MRELAPRSYFWLWLGMGFGATALTPLFGGDTSVKQPVCEGLVLGARPIQEELSDAERYLQWFSPEVDVSLEGPNGESLPVVLVPRSYSHRFVETSEPWQTKDLIVGWAPNERAVPQGAAFYREGQSLFAEPDGPRIRRYLMAWLDSRGRGKNGTTLELTEESLMRWLARLFRVSETHQQAVAFVIQVPESGAGRRTFPSWEGLGLKRSSTSISDSHPGQKRWSLYRRLRSALYLSDPDILSPLAQSQLLEMELFRDRESFVDSEFQWALASLARLYADHGSAFREVRELALSAIGGPILGWMEQAGSNRSVLPVRKIPFDPGVALGWLRRETQSMARAQGSHLFHHSIADLLSESKAGQLSPLEEGALNLHQISALTTIFKRFAMENQKWRRSSNSPSSGKVSFEFAPDVEIARWLQSVFISMKNLHLHVPDDRGRWKVLADVEKIISYTLRTFSIYLDSLELEGVDREILTLWQGSGIHYLRPAQHPFLPDEGRGSPEKSEEEESAVGELRNWLINRRFGL